MSLFNDNLKNIKIRTVLIILIVSYLILFLLSKFGFPFNQTWIYIVLIFYFIFKLRRYGESFKEDLKSVFSKIDLKFILFVVFLNIFFSYGMLYLTNYAVSYFPQLMFLVNFSLPSMAIIDNLPLIGGFVSTVVIASVCEELIFRGVFLSRLRLIVPTVFAVLISSLLFGALHSFGSMTSAVVFAICMAILYLKSDNICVPILAHFLNNLFAEIIRLVDVHEVLFNNPGVMLVIGVLAVISAIILFISIFKELKMLNNKTL